jgi:hypothetical protein
MFYDDLLYSLIIGFAGAALFLLVNRLEPNRAMGGLLKFLVLFVSGVVNHAQIALIRDFAVLVIRCLTIDTRSTRTSRSERLRLRYAGRCLPYLRKASGPRRPAALLSQPMTPTLSVGKRRFRHAAVLRASSRASLYLPVPA